MGKTAAKDLIVAITDAKKGALRTTATQEGYKTYVIPDDIGGRYSVLTPVGLVPLAIAGFDIRALVKGAMDMEKITDSSSPFENKSCLPLCSCPLYALSFREERLKFSPILRTGCIFWLNGGNNFTVKAKARKERAFFLPAWTFTADLHSMGQYIQEGERILSKR